MDTNEELNRQVADLQQQVAGLQEQLKNQEKMASLGLLSAGIVHEIRNPLNFVINFSKVSTSLLKDMLDIVADNEDKISADDRDELDDIVSDLHENLSKIAEHGERAISIIQNILLYSRGKEDEYLPTDVVKLTKEYVNLSYHAMRANLAKFNIKIEENYQDGLPQVEVVPQDLSRAILNVMNNACYAVWERTAVEGPDYMPTICVGIRADNGELCISIADNGKGMTEEVKQRLYETFFTTKPVGQGTGLGMYVTRNIIENKHHGRIEFTSAENQGTTFRLLIPMKRK